MPNEYILSTVHLATENPALLLACKVDDASALRRTKHPPGVGDHIQDGTGETICIQTEELTAIKMPPGQDQTSSSQDLFFQEASWLRGKLERMGEPSGPSGGSRTFIFIHGIAADYKCVMF